MIRLLAALACLWLAHFLASGIARADEPSPRHVILIIPDGMTRANEAGLSWYLHGQEGGDYSLSFHGWPLHAPVTTWDISTYNDYANDPRFGSAQPDPRHGYDAARGGTELLLHPDERTDAYFLQGQEGPDAKGSQFATDSAAAATAMATGVKVEGGVLAWDAADDRPLPSVSEQLRGQFGGRMGIGIVSDVPFSHATPAGFSAHDAKRGSYHAIAFGQLSFMPDVLAGGGHPLYDKDYNSGKAPRYIMWEQYEWLRAHPALAFCERTAGEDGAGLFQAAADRARAEDLPLFGLFGIEGGHLNAIEADNNQPDGFDYGTQENPDCWELAQAALTVLSDSERFPEGFLLMVEQGDLDWANHAGNWAWGLGAMRDTDNTARRLVEWIERGEGHNLTPENTLVLLVADHAHYHRTGPQFRPAAGELPAGADEKPEPDAADPYQRRFTPDRAVVYSRALTHSNEMVMLYGWGAGGQSGLEHLFAPYLGRSYQGLDGVPGAIDNTAVYHLICDWLKVDAAAAS